MEVPQPQEVAWARLLVSAQAVMRSWKADIGPVVPWSTARAVRKLVERHGANLYGVAANTLGPQPLTLLDGRVTMFIKAEKWPDQPSIPLKTARAIQYRGPRYNIMLTKYLAPVEDALYAHLRDPHNRQRLFSSKGLSGVARAELLYTLWNRHARPAAIAIDHSRFDAHIGRGALQLEHSVYRMFLGDQRLLLWLLNQQLVNRGTGTHGTRYKLDGGRMSGDVNTALGNTIINGLVLSCLCQGRPVDILIEGDDGVILGEYGDIAFVAGVIGEGALQLGFELKSSGVLTSVLDIRFCSCFYLHDEGRHQYYAVREVFKPFETDPWCAKVVEGHAALVSKGWTMAFCYGILYVGLPLYAEWAAYMLSHCPRLLPSGRVVRFDPGFDRELAMRARAETRTFARRDVEIGPQLRADFALATGIVPSEQLRLEAVLRGARGSHQSHLVPSDFNLAGLGAPG